MNCDVLVVGAGAAGMAAALSAREAGAEKVVLADRGTQLGGVLPQCLHTGFGLGYFHRELTGAEYAARWAARVAASDVALRLDTTVLSLSPERLALLSSPEGVEEIAFQVLVLAAGCREIPIGALALPGTRPAGVFTAGQAQRMVNLQGLSLGRNAVILGSGDVGLVMARQLTLAGCAVAAVVEQRERCGGLPGNYSRSIAACGIPLLTRTTVSCVHGTGRLTGVTLRQLDTGAERFLACDTLITALGMVPERELLRPLGEPLPPWVLLCGNCRYIHRTVDTVSRQGEAAGREAAARLRRPSGCV